MTVFPHKLIVLPKGATAIVDIDMFEERPLLHPEAAKEKAQSEQPINGAARLPWREIPLADHFQGEILRLLTEGGIATIGALADFTAAGKKLTEIEGIGQGRAVQIAERMDDFWRTHPNGPSYAEAAP